MPAAAPAMRSSRRIGLRVRVVALVRWSDVRERREERAVVPVHAVAELVVRLQVTEPERGMQERAVAARDRTQLEVHDVVAEPPSVRESREVAVQDAE